MSGGLDLVVPLSPSRTVHDSDRAQLSVVLEQDHCRRGVGLQPSALRLKYTRHGDYLAIGLDSTRDSVDAAAGR